MEKFIKLILGEFVGGVIFVMLIFVNEAFVKAYSNWAFSSVTICWIWGILGIGSPFIAYLPEIIEFFQDL